MADYVANPHQKTANVEELEADVEVVADIVEKPKKSKKEEAVDG